MPGELFENTTFDFCFANAEKQHETYRGINASLRYFVRATIMRRFGPVVMEHDIAVHTLSSYPDMTQRCGCLRRGRGAARSRSALARRVPLCSRDGAGTV